MTDEQREAMEKALREANARSEGSDAGKNPR
jgi:hypothetical protein